MARPIKKGLDYFSFDVDFFDDGKIMAISKEFGVKGEVVAVRLLCAIFREGYFLQWNDTNRVKLSMGLPSVSDALLEQIVRGLVRWGFFDKDLFGSAGVLTSRGIQKRYFSSVRRRKGEGDLPYLLLDKRELLQAETGLMATKTPFMYAETPKVKESKENIKEKKKEKEKSEKKSEEEGARCLDAADVLRLYNKALRIFGEKYPGWECKLRYARKMTQERERNCSILAERFTETEIKQAWWNACLNPFCNGRTKDRHKPADIDWMLQEKVFVRLLEGSLG